MTGAHRRARAAFVPVLACLWLLAACDYIVTPAEEATPTPATGTGTWTAVTTKVEAGPNGLHVDLTIRNDTGDWSALAVASGAVNLVTADGARKPCATAFVGTGGTRLPPGFQMRGFTGGTKTAPETQLLYVECVGAAPAAGQKLSIDYTYDTGDFNYYTPGTPRPGTLEVPLDALAKDLNYPVAQPVTGLVAKADAPIGAINQCRLTLTAVTRTADTLELSWHTDNPTAYPSYVHIGIPPVIGADGIVYGRYESPHLADTPITPAGQSAEWKTTATVPPDVHGLYLLVMVESKQQKTFVSHALDITDK